MASVDGKPVWFCAKERTRQGHVVSAHELIDAKALAALEPVGDFGAFVVTCRDDGCSLASSTTRMDLDFVRLWPIVQQRVTRISTGWA